MTAPFTPEQEARIREIIGDVLETHARVKAHIEGQSIAIALNWIDDELREEGKDA